MEREGMNELRQRRTNTDGKGEEGTQIIERRKNFKGKREIPDEDRHDLLKKWESRQKG
jgi:hypothetical protein